MKSPRNSILSINSGSSSIKFAFYTVSDGLTATISGNIENIGTENTKLNFTDFECGEKNCIDVQASDFDQATIFLIDWLEKQNKFLSLSAIGHRLVHGMNLTKPQLINSELLADLKHICTYDPDHLPGEIKLIELLRKRHPNLPQIACFDTTFHADMPSVAKLLTIPRRYYELGIHRYGFHGLSYSYLMEELDRKGPKGAAHGKIILAHLGSGASLAAVIDGKSLDTSMGFTPTSGLVMGTRTGDLDPGVVSYLMQVEKLSPIKFSHLINHESGLLGVSATSSNMQELLKTQHNDPRAAEAVELFCYQTKKWIGSFAAVLGGLDTLVFSGGIGENASEIRKRICEGMEFLGIEIDNIKNENNDSSIAKESSKVSIQVMKTNEELMIARMVLNIINAIN